MRQTQWSRRWLSYHSAKPTVGIAHKIRRFFSVGRSFLETYEAWEVRHKRHWRLRWIQHKCEHSVRDMLVSQEFFRLVSAFASTF